MQIETESPFWMWVERHYGLYLFTVGIVAALIGTALIKWVL